MKGCFISMESLAHFLMFITPKTQIWVCMFLETLTLSKDVLFNRRRLIILIKTCVLKVKVTERTLEKSRGFFGLTL